MTPVHVVGIGLDGADGLVESVRQLVQSNVANWGAIAIFTSPNYFQDNE